MHPFGEPKHKPSADRRQQNLDRLALRTAILAQRLEDGLAKTWMEGTRDKAIEDGAAPPVLRDTTAMTTSTGPMEGVPHAQDRVPILSPSKAATPTRRGPNGIQEKRMGAGSVTQN